MAILEPVLLENVIPHDDIERLKKMFYSNPFSRVKLPNNMITLKKKEEIRRQQCLSMYWIH